MPRIVMPSDVFPPKCGGAGWSAHALARALLAHGQAVVAVVPQPGAASAAIVDVAGVPTVHVAAATGTNPLLRWLSRLLLLRRWRRAIAAQSTTGAVVVHAQHVLAAQAAMPLRDARRRVVVTIRDHWPWDMRATGMAMAGDQRTIRGAWQTLRLRGASWVHCLAAPLYAIQMRRRAQLLAAADLVIAVSEHIAGRVRATAPTATVVAIPNMVDVDAIAAVCSQPPHTAVSSEYVLFVGKLAANKGAQYLPALIAQIRPPAIVIAGDGPLAEPIAAAAAAAGVPCTITAWVDHDEVLRLLGHAAALWFPSSWDEPLSRVLLEALACATPIIAMPTGGTSDIIVDGESGLLAPDIDAFVAAARRLAADPALVATLRQHARARAVSTFAVDAVIPRYLAAYAALEHQP